MDAQRNLLIIALLIASFMVYQTWEQDKNSQLQYQSTHIGNVKTNNLSNRNILKQKEDQGKEIIIKTDVLKLVVNTYGGNIEQALLLTYPKELKSKESFSLLETTSDFVYQAESGFINCNIKNNADNHFHIPIYNINTNMFVLADNQNKIVVPMTCTDTTGNIFTKIFTLKRGSYAIDVTYTVHNTSNKPLLISTFGQLNQSIKLPAYRNTDNSNFALHTFRGAVYSTSEIKYKKYSFDTILKNKNLDISSKDGWVAMVQQYFATAWIPDNTVINNFYTSNLGHGVMAIGYKSQPTLVQSGKTTYLNSVLWIGPEIQDKMSMVAPYLDLTVDYGWLWFISQPLFKMLKFINGFLGNWGCSIIMITFIVRGLMYPLTKAQYISMAKMRMLQPKIMAMRERLANDTQRQNQEIMALYKSEKLNPLGGCFPLLIQMPIFLALYYMLIGSVELRHAPFILWIYDLSARDPYYILPILMGVTMFLIQKMSPSNITDPIQQKVLICMPIIFTIFFLWFPSGLVLYYIMSNLVTIIQQQLIYRDLEKCGLYNYDKKNIK